MLSVTSVSLYCSSYKLWWFCLFVCLFILTLVFRCYRFVVPQITSTWSCITNCVCNALKCNHALVSTHKYTHTLTYTYIRGHLKSNLLNHPLLEWLTLSSSSLCAYILHFRFVGCWYYLDFCICMCKVFITHTRTHLNV